MRDRIADRLALEHDLRRALERDEFCLMFQPIVTLDEDGTMVAGLEALLRWDRPTRGLVPASFFIECAEASGLLTEIGDWVIREVGPPAGRVAPGARSPRACSCRSTSRALHLKSAALPARVRRRPGRDRPRPPTRCASSSAESTLMDNPAEGVALVIRLKELGVRLAVDDFGNGYASLAYLKQFPVDYVKIDRRFIEGLIGSDPTDETLVAAIVSMAQALDAVDHRRGRRARAPGAGHCESSAATSPRGSCTRGRSSADDVIADDAGDLAPPRAAAGYRRWRRRSAKALTSAASSAARSQSGGRTAGSSPVPSVIIS